MALKIIGGDSAPRNTNIFACIYGDPGLGKSSWAITAEEPLVLDFDQRAHRAYNAKAAKRIDVTRFDDIAEAANTYKGQFKTLVVDTAGRAVESASDEIIAQSKQSPSMKAHNSFGGLSLQGFGILKRMFYDMAREVRKSGMHCLFVCHGKRTKEGEQVSWEPDVMGSSVEEIYKISDLMGLVTSFRDSTVARFNPSELWSAKNPLNLGTITLRPKDTEGWQITLKELIDRCAVEVNKTAAPVELHPMHADIDKCNTVEQANDILQAILSMEDGAQKDMLTTSFKTMRTKNGFSYTKEKGVFKK